VAIPADRNVVQKEAEKNLKYKILGIQITTNVEPEMYDYTSNNWSHWKSNEKLNPLKPELNPICYLLGIIRSSPYSTH
jgi:transposase